MKSTAKTTAIVSGNWSHPPGSNRRPADYESVIDHTGTNRNPHLTGFPLMRHGARLGSFSEKVLHRLLQSAVAL